MTQVDHLLQHASTAREHAYAPYSNFRVGAAVLCRDGRVFVGCNVENASYPLSICAERTALGAAIAAGYRPGDFVHMAVVGSTRSPIRPCGACRQVMFELGGSEMPVALGNLDGHRLDTNTAELLPGAFSLPSEDA